MRLVVRVAHAIRALRAPSTFQDVDFGCSLRPRSQAEEGVAGMLARKPCGVRSPVLQLRHDDHDVPQRLSYSSWRHHTPVSLCPFWGAIEPLVHTREAVQIMVTATTRSTPGSSLSAAAPRDKVRSLRRSWRPRQQCSLQCLQRLQISSRSGIDCFSPTCPRLGKRPLSHLMRYLGYRAKQSLEEEEVK